MRLLGGFEVAVDGRPVAADEWRHRRGADLVKLLALAPQHKLHRDQVMQQLWPELGAEAAAANLRKAVHFARRALGALESIETSGEMLVLWPEGNLVVDAWRFEAEANRALANESAFELALPLYTGELLPEDRYAEWTEPHRERLQQRYLQLLRKLGRWEDVLQIDRTDEIACRALMRAYLDAGDRAAAIRQFQHLRDVLRVDLGVAPERESVALFEEAVASQAGEPLSGPESVQALLARGLMNWSDGDLRAAQTLAEQARALALGQHLGRELGEASALLGMVAMALGRWPDWFRTEFTTAIQLKADQEPFMLDAHICLAEASLTSTNPQHVGALARESLDRAIEFRSTRGEALMSLLIGESELYSGRVEAADEWLSRASALYARLGGGSGMVVTLMRLGEVASIRRKHVQAERQLSSARGLAESSPLVAHVRPRVLEAMVKTAQRPEDCEVVVEQAEVLFTRPKEVCRPCSIGLAVAAAIACARRGNLARARYWLAHAERLAGMWSGGPWQAAVWEARAALRAAEGDVDQANALLNEAGSLFAQFGRTLDVARCRSAIAVG